MAREEKSDGETGKQAEGNSSTAGAQVVPIRPVDSTLIPPRIVTSRLVLRPLSEGDAPDVFAYAADAEMTRYLLWDAHQSIDDSLVFLRHVAGRYALGEPYDWGIEWNGRVIGTIGLFDRRISAERAEVGFALGRAYWRQGFMRESLTAILDHAFCDLALRRVVARTHVQNQGSRALLASTGFTQEGTLRQDIYAKGLFWDVAYFGLLVGEFKPRQTPIERRKRAPARAPR